MAIVGRQNIVSVWLRIAIGVMALIWALGTIPDALFLYSSASGTQPECCRNSYSPSIFHYINDDWLIMTSLYVLAAASVLVIAGRSLRFASLAVCFVSFSFTKYDITGFGHAGDFLLRLLSVYLLIFVWVEGPNAVRLRSGWEPRIRPTWLVYLVRAQIAFVYFSAGASKARGAGWQNGTAAGRVLETGMWVRYPVPDWLLHSETFVHLATWSVVMFELSIGFLLLWRPTRKFAIIAALLFHLGLEYTLSVGLVSIYSAISLISFVDEGRASVCTAGWARRLGRRRARVLNPPGV